MHSRIRLIICIASLLFFLACGLLWASADPVELTGAERLAIVAVLGIFASIGLFYFLKQDEIVRESRQILQQSESARDRFSVSMGHEIRTPLSGILGIMHLLKRTQLDRNQQRYVDTASNSADMLLTIINDSLSRSRMNTGMLLIESENLVLAEVFEDVTSILAPEAFSKGLELVCDIDPEIPYRIKGDALRLRQVLNNLLSNAINYTENGDIAIYAVNNGSALEIGVKDSGVGIGSEQRQALLKPLGQMDTNFDRESGWLGLGLKNSRRLINAMGSELQIESKPGEGSRFYFALTIDSNLGEAYDWKPPQALQELSIAILSPLESQRHSIRNMLAQWSINKIQEIDYDADNNEDLPELSPCDVFIIDQAKTEQAVNYLIDRLRNDSDWRDTQFVHLVPQNREGEGGSADLRLYKPLSHSRLYAMVLDIVYKIAFNAEYDPDLEGSANGSPGVLAGQRILLVEDNDISRMIVLEMLGETGADIDISVNGAESVERVQQQKYELILMDLEMPIMDGYEATRKIRGMGGYFESIPIIAMTAHAREGDISKSLDAGMNYHISKPFEPDNLIATIARFIEQRSQ